MSRSRRGSILQPLPPSGRQSKLNRTALAGREPNRASLPLRADPAAGALIGTVVLFGLLALPGSLILVLIVGVVIGIARSLRTRRKPKVDKEFAARFRELENCILDAPPQRLGARTSQKGESEGAQDIAARAPKEQEGN